MKKLLVKKVESYSGLILTKTIPSSLNVLIQLQFWVQTEGASNKTHAVFA